MRTEPAGERAGNALSPQICVYLLCKLVLADAILYVYVVLITGHVCVCPMKTHPVSQCVEIPVTSVRLAYNFQSQDCFALFLDSVHFWKHCPLAYLRSPTLDSSCRLCQFFFFFFFLPQYFLCPCQEFSWIALSHNLPGGLMNSPLPPFHRHCLF